MVLLEGEDLQTFHEEQNKMLYLHSMYLVTN